MIFYPTEINYNTLRRQAQPYVLLLQDPRAVHNNIKFTIRPPRTRSHLRGDEAWNPWWRTTLLVQSQDTLPLLTLDASSGEPTSYLGEALKQALQASVAFMFSIQELQAAHSQSTILLRAAPDGAYGSEPAGSEGTSCSQSTSSHVSSRNASGRGLEDSSSSSHGARRSQGNAVFGHYVAAFPYWNIAFSIGICAFEQ